MALDPKIGGGAFHPFQKEDRVAPPPVAAEASSTAERVGMSGGEDKDKDKEGHSRSQRKARRCWSPELHRRFLHALQQLGGSHGELVSIFVDFFSLIAKVFFLKKKN